MMNTMTESLVTSDDLQYFAKQLSEANFFSSVELHDLAGQIAWSVKDVSEGKPLFFQPIPLSLAPGTIEVHFDGENNKILAAHQSSPDEIPQSDDVVVIIPQPVQLKQATLESSTSPKRSRSFWKNKNKTAVAASV